MTLQQLFESATANSSLLIYLFLALPVLAFFLSWISDEEGNQNPWRYFFSTLIYMVCIPGIFAIILCIYSFFFERQNLLQVNVLIYFLPILSMLATLLFIRRKVDLAEIPGFDRIGGFMMVIAATFIIILILQKMRIWVVFMGSMWHLLALFLVLFVGFKIGFERLMRKGE